MSSGLSVAAFAAYKTLAISVPVLIDAALGRVSVEKCDELLEGWSRAIVERAQIDLQVEGLERVPQGRAYLLMSNHQSHFDIPLLYQAWRFSPRTLRMVAKAELFRIPVFGGALRESGFVSVDRSGDRANAERAMRDCAAAIERGINIWIAPEGTRSPDGKLGRFKKGGFLLAQTTGVPIVPIAIAGSREILPKHSRNVQRGVKVKITFFPPISPTQPKRPIAELMAEVRRQVASGLPPEAVAPEPGT
jgi:1-acyl-sn-glycerol-3-phosphate acyltransferase